MPKYKYRVIGVPQFATKENLYATIDCRLPVDLETIAIIAAKDFNFYHVINDDAWPLIFKLYTECGKPLGEFIIFMNRVPSFTALPREESACDTK